jgi:hypothetical protein
MAHVRALEDPSALASITGLWHNAFKHWASVYASDTFWDMVQARIREMSDPRLTPATARQMREAPPSVLLSISAQLALWAGQEGRLADATEHISLMHQSGFGPEAADRLLRQQAEPDLAQLRSMSQDAERSADEDPRRGAEAARRLLSQAKPLIYLLGSVLPKEDPLLQGIRDEVASTALSCVVQYVNETDDLGSAATCSTSPCPSRLPIRQGTASVTTSTSPRPGQEGGRGTPAGPALRHLLVRQGEPGHHCGRVSAEDVR